MSTLEQSINRVNAALRREAQTISYRVVTSVALLIANKSIPLAPVDTGHLRNSSVVMAYRGNGPTRTQKNFKTIKKWDAKEENLKYTALKTWITSSKDPMALVAFIAHYALYVHEGNPSFNWNDGGPKFLEKGVNASIPLIPAVAQAAVRAKGKLSTGGLDADAQSSLNSGSGDTT